MAHDPTLLRNFESRLSQEYPEDVYLVIREKNIPGTHQRPDLQFRAKGNLTQILCVVEVGKASQTRFATYVELGIPDVRWYTHAGVLKEHYCDEHRLTQMRTESLASLLKPNGKKPKKIVWTQAARRELYTACLFTFGSQSSWPTNSRRPPVPSEVFWKFCELQAAFLGPRLGKEISKEAVEQQISWATTDQETIKPTHVYSWLMCKSAAREVGLIDKSGFPEAIQAIQKRGN